MSYTAIDDAAWDSPWRRHRVADKLLLSVGLIVVAVLSDPWPGCLAVLVVALGCMLGPAKVPPRLVLTVLAAPVVFLALGTLPLVIQWDPAAPTVIGWTGQGLHQAGMLWARSLAGTSALVLLALTTPMIDVLGWLRRRRVPDPLLEVASLTYRLIFVLLATTIQLRAAQRARLGDTRSWRSRWRTTATTIGSILLLTGGRVTRLQAGLAGRGMEDSLTTLAPRSVRTPRFFALALGAPTLILMSTLLWRLR